ncbi:MAG TPA: histidine kinase [Terracidiphilus sp.]
MNTAENSASGALSLRVSIAAFFGLFVAAAALAVITANECHYNLLLRHVRASYTPSLLYGLICWFWWIGLLLALWLPAESRSRLLRFSLSGVLVHAGLASLFGIAHLALLQFEVRIASEYWPAWGSLYSSMRVTTLWRFGVDLLIYALIYSFSGFLHAQSEAQRAIVLGLRLERQLSQAQLKALQMQMEPHFLFNTLNAITSLVAQGRNPEAMKTLGHLHTILRATLQRKAPEKVPFVDELRVVESYLAIQQVRFAGRLQVEIDTTPEALEGLIPCFVLQPIVENAIQHGIAPRASGGLVKTRVKRVGDTLWMQVKDSGCGPGGSSTEGHGIGMNNIRERLAYFYPGAHQFQATAPADGGYEVTIQIPYERATA